MIKGSIYQEDIAILNVYAPCNRTAKHVKKNLIELKGEMDKFTITVGNLNSLPSTIGRITRQKMSKVIKELENTINQQDLGDIYRALHPTIA